jgi:hypothetical protein
VAFYGDEILKTAESISKYVGRFAMWCRTRMETIIMTDRERNEEILRRINKENILHGIYREVRITGCSLRCGS